MNEKYTVSEIGGKKKTIVIDSHIFEGIGSY